jgi:hypothetical protein
MCVECQQAMPGSAAEMTLHFSCMYLSTTGLQRTMLAQWRAAIQHLHPDLLDIGRKLQAGTVKQRPGASGHHAGSLLSAVHVPSQCMNTLSVFNHGVHTSSRTHANGFSMSRCCKQQGQ